MSKWVIGALSLFVLLFVVMATPVFNIQEVTVSGGDHYNADQIRAMAHLTTGKSFLRLNRTEVAHRLTRDPWIRTATVRWRMPHSAEIDFTERRPLARFYARGESYLIADDGVVLETGWRASQPGILEVMDLTDEAIAGHRGEPLQFDDSKSFITFLSLLQANASKLGAFPAKVEVQAGGHILVTFDGKFPALTFWDRVSAPQAFKALLDAYNEDPAILAGGQFVIGISSKTLVVSPAPKAIVAATPPKGRKAA